MTQPVMKQAGQFTIAGISGDGGQTAKVWARFEEMYGAKPFAKAYADACEVRFYSNEEQGKDIFVGYALAEGADVGGFETLVLPAVPYAVFDVLVTQGYDSGNATMDKWLDDNAHIYGALEMDGKGFIVECYTERFKDGDKPDSVVEMWVPLYRVCQSCSMPMTKAADFGKNADGTPSADYCCYCHSNGAFGNPDETLEEMIESCIPFCWEQYVDDDAARADMRARFPKLKRWAK